MAHRLGKDDLVHPAALTDSMTCPICMEIFQDPVFACGKPCQHVFCRDCIRHCLEGRSKCPTCRQAMKYKNIQRHQPFESLVNEMQVLCPAKCGWTGRYDSRNGHMDSCPLVILKRDIQALDKQLEANLAKRSELDQKIKTMCAELAHLEKASKEADKEHNRLMLERQGSWDLWEAAKKENPGAAKRPFTQEGSGDVAEPQAKNSRVGPQLAQMCAQKQANDRALVEAAQKGKLQAVKRLLQVGATARTPDKDGWIPLHWAASNGHLEVAKCLVEEAGVNTSAAKSSNGWTPLHVAAVNGQLRIVKYLVEQADSNVNAKNNDGATPLYLAAFRGHLRVAQYLVQEAHADVKVSDNNRRTPRSVVCTGYPAQMFNKVQIELLLEAAACEAWNPTPR
mmetsp:Transcript_4794/g.11426  ORF Transcript_4794/g.11426 Transcript_4794/m.11426 type:complete len:395 (-) Transcript_4794:142-1326(-)|eukprot:CAMPEP_0206474694 /NCGR_PEP_ID=MMETSP0324_2-20121206/33636_1 /ASSEMBLY_ACC=CAM_ASM_000836 /TAXON_ID=2866 /ORGANISM="Crypthecodinium cohnii, Strain Seligo" /LENGTH=394 /DNA_ID=CAMNT_0053949909 /DNA_START=206 /DNA_END=1390 /DNA_ORIENTATION=-